jgi:methionine synthase II (cobalamin-independent)
MTLPSPSLMASLWTSERSRDAYPALEDFLADVVAILVDAVRELSRLGCTYVQLDAPHYRCSSTRPGASSTPLGRKRL